MGAARASPIDLSQDSIRKRVCKACDRCRLKKSKCDGHSPCSRCKADNAICVFGERKKSQDKIYPKGYVEVLERQQDQLVTALRTMYTRLHRGEGWPGPPLEPTNSGQILTHDILDGLGMLHRSSDGDGQAAETFEEDCVRIQHRLLDEGAPLTHRRGSVSSDSDHGHSSISSHQATPLMPNSMHHSPSYAHMHSPLTPPAYSVPEQQDMALPLKQEDAMSRLFANTGGLDPSLMMEQTWPDEAMMLDETMNFSQPAAYSFGQYNTMWETEDPTMNSMSLQAISPAMPSPWDPGELEDEYRNPFA